MTSLQRARAQRRMAAQADFIDLLTPAKQPGYLFTTRPAAEAEPPAPMLQPDLFGETAKEVKPKAAKAQPVEMFSAREVLQFGVTARPYMPIDERATTSLGLFAEDPRTPEERERDLRHAAEALTVPLEDLADFESDPQHRADYQAWLDSLPTFQE